MPLDPMLPFWCDNDIRFDLMTRYLKPCSGEKVFEVLEPVEDTKGNNGEAGKLIVTNLRIIWQSKKYPKINLSIGYNPITSVSIKSASSKLRGMTESLHILAKTRTSRYEFIFTNLVVDHNRLFSVIIGVHRAYTQSKLYREIKMRSGLIVTNKKLQMLAQEVICEQINGVWNLSSDQGNLGSFFITNVRVVWYAATNELFNASIPFLQIAEIKIRDSKFGKALVIETREAGGSYVLGFRVDPKEKLYQAYKTLMAIQEAYIQQPVYGVEFNSDCRENYQIGCSEQRTEMFYIIQKSISDSTGALRLNISARGTIYWIERHGSYKNSLDQETEEEKAHRLTMGIVEEVDEIDDNPEFASDAFAAYFADGYSETNKKLTEIVYNEELGLAIEKPKDGFTMQSLWEVIPSS